MIITLILAILNMIMYLVYIIATSGLATGLYLFLSFSNALLIPLLAVQAVEDAIPPELELMQRKISQRNRIPVQRLFLAILIAAPVGILTGYFTNDNVMAMVLLFFNLLSFSWFAYEHDSDYRAFMRPDRKVESKEQNIDDYRLVSQSENELLAPISDSTERLESSESESVVALDWKIVCTKTTFYGLVSKLPRLFYYCYYWCLLTVVLIYMYQLSCQFRYNKEEIKPAYLRVYPLLFTVASYPVIEWKILPELKVHKTFHKLLLSTVCAVLSLIVATILESYRVTETYGTDYYSQNPFTDKRVSSCPADLDDYCNDVPYSSTYKACHYPPMMSEQLHVGWQSIQFLLLSFSISLAGSCFLDFCFYEVDDKALKPNTVNGIDEDDALEFDQKCTEIVDLVGSVLVKPLKDLTTEQTVLFFKSVGCLGIEDVLKEKRIVLTGKHLNTVETLEDLLSLDLNLPRIMVRTILEEILHCKDCGVRMSKLLRNVSRCA
eukprot:gene7246-7820_t